MDNPLHNLPPPLTTRINTRDDVVSNKESESISHKPSTPLAIASIPFNSIETSSETSPHTLIGRVTSSSTLQRPLPLILDPQADIPTVNMYLEEWVNEALEEQADRKKAKDTILLFLDNPLEKRLVLSGNFSRLPDVFHHNLIKKIKRLDITGGAKLTDLPPSLTTLRGMEHLFLNECTNLRRLPESFGDLSELKTLNFSYVGLEQLPNVGALTQLKAINFSNCARLESLPESIGELKELFAIILTNCSRLVELPKSIGQLKTLKRLLLSGCINMREIPKEICNLQISETQIQDPYGCPLPIDKAAHLLPLDATRKDIEHYLSQWVGETPIETGREAVLGAVMRFLDSSENTLSLHGKFSELPSVFHANLFSKVTHLSLIGCTELTTVPPSIYMLSKLQVLNFSGCTKLKQLPEDIDRLTDLQVLDLSGCRQFLKLPSALTQLNKLKVFDIRGCVLLPGSDPIGKRQLAADGSKTDRSWFSVLSESPSCVLYEVTPGKPASKDACLCKEPMTLPARTIQPAQKQGTCWYYTFNYLRQRVGKGGEGCDVHQNRRTIEKSISSVRKKITKYESELRWYYEVDTNQKLKGWLTAIDRNKAIDFFNENEINKNDLFKKEFAECYNVLPPEKIRGALLIEWHQLWGKLKEFLNSPKEIKNLHEFLIQNRGLGRKAITDDYLKQVLPAYIGVMEARKEELGPVNFFEQHGGDLVFLTEVARNYQLHYSAWSPNQGVASLIKEITQTGPVAVYGFIGAPYYKERPLPTGEVFGERQTYFWNADARISTYSSPTHMLLLVGAKKEADGEFVYFIDPNNESNPSNRESQRIYRMPYQELLENIRPLAVPYLDKESQTPALLTPYAYCKK